MTSPKTNYRADIDGLRALAALSVLLFHYKFPFFDGGYVGVDVFLVISGYLIYGTSLSHVTDFAGVLGFFRRRIARIFPALLLVVAVTLIATRLLIPARRVGDTYEAALAGLGFFANHYFYATADYFATTTTSPFIHLWSISLEEQFYLVFPFILLAAARWRLQAMIALLLLSLTASLVYENTSAVYYLLPFRMWEFCLGAALVHARAPRIEKVGGIATAIGLVLIASGLSMASAYTVWKFDHLLPAVGTALVLYGGLTSNAVSRIVGLPVFSKIGESSYSIYLIHWPLWTLFLMGTNRLPGLIETWILMIATLALAVASFKFVERPLLLRIRAASSKATFVMTFVALATCAAIALALKYERKSILLPRVISSPLGKAIAEAAEPKIYESAYRRRTCLLQEDQSPKDLQIPTCTSPVVGRKMVLLWGDSYAAHLFPGLIASQSDVWHFTLASAGSCAPLLNHSDKRCLEFHRHVVKEILPALKPDIVILAGNWASAGSADAVEESLAEILKVVGSASVVMIAQGPSFATAVPLLIPERYFEADSMPDQIWIDDPGVSFNSKLVERVSRLGIVYFDLNDHLCKNGRCEIVRDGKLMIWDRGGHLTIEGSKSVAPHVLKLLPED